MKRIIFIIFIGITASLSAMRQDPTAAGQLLHVPYDVKGIIWGKVVNSSIESFASLARVNKALHTFSYGTYLNSSASNPNIAIKVITAAAQQVLGADELDIFQRLQQKKLLTQERASKVSAWLYHVRVPQLVLEKMLRKEGQHLFEGDRALFQQLVALGVDINGASRRKGKTILYRVCGWPSFAEPTFSWLLNFNVDVNKATKKSKRTPLMWAILCGNSMAVERLLDADADWKVCNAKGENAFDKAMRRWTFRAIEGIFLRSPKIPCDSKIEMIDRVLEKHKDYLTVADWLHWLQQHRTRLLEEKALCHQITLVPSSSPCSGNNK